MTAMNSGLRTMPRSRSPKKTKPVKAWALLNPDGTINAWLVTKLRRWQQLRAENARTYLKKKCEVIPVLITPAPAPKRRKK